MRKVLIAAALAAFVSPAAAGVGTWFKDDRWTVEANSDYRYCVATTTYNDGRRLSISLLNGEASLFIGKTNAIEGEKYRVGVSSGSSGSSYLVGQGIGDGVIVFEGLLPPAIYGMAKGKRLFVEGIGSLEMTGSYNAISKTIECEKAMRELL